MMEFRFIFIAIFCLVYTPSSLSQSLSLGGYLERCNRANPCDEDINLTCVDGFCECSQSEEMMYDFVRERCVIRESRRCVTPKFDFGEFNPCVSNSYCSKDRVCTCSSYAFSDGQGQCLQRKIFNDTCLSNRECDNLRYLGCIDGICQCDRFTAYDDYHQVCRRRAGESCRKSQECVNNAECIDSKCVCRKNFIEASDRSCGLTYGMPCSGGEQDSVSACSDVYFACINGKCSCKNPSYEEYSRKTKSCLSLVGGLCHLFMTNNRQPLRLKNCVQHAECVRREFSALSQCECEKGYVETISGKCQLAFGSSCDTQGSDEAGQCDESVPLVCRNSVCDCTNEFDTYDRMDRTCRRMAGSICQKGTDSCVYNATCDRGRCRCRPGYQTNFRGMCDTEMDVEISGSQNLKQLKLPNSRNSFPMYK